MSPSNWILLSVVHPLDNVKAVAKCWMNSGKSGDQTYSFLGIIFI